MMFNKKEVRIFLKGQAIESYLRLKSKNDKESKTLLRSFERIKEILRENPQFGNPIRKGLVPQEIKKLGIKNLYRVDLSHYWRALYTIEGNELSIFLFVLNIVDHKAYDKLFRYK